MDVIGTAKYSSNGPHAWVFYDYYKYYEYYKATTDNIA